MLVQLPDGRTVEMSIDDYLNLDDSGYQNLIASKYYGVDINNPFFKPYCDKKENPQDDFIEFDEDMFEGLDINDIPSEFKALDQDYEINEEE